MAAPNIVNVTSIFGKTATLAVTTSASAVVSNAAASNKVLKVGTLYVANIDGVNNCDVTVDVFDGTTAWRVANTITVPADASLLLIGKDGPIYLEEGWSLRLTASANSDLEAVCSYEEIA